MHGVLCCAVLCILCATLLTDHFNTARSSITNFIKLLISVIKKDYLFNKSGLYKCLVVTIIRTLISKIRGGD